MIRFFKLITILITVLVLSSCYDDTEEECDDAPLSCDEIRPVSGTLHFNLTIDADNPSVVIDLREGDDFDTGTPVVPAIPPLSTTSYSDTFANGDYSARVIYTVEYRGNTYTVEVIDGVDLSYESDDYCDGITCYEEGSETLELEFDRDAFIAELEGSGKECFIATAAYGSGDAWQVGYLRSFRDRVLKKSAAGRFFIREYYAHSPAAAGFISGRPALKYTVSGILTVLIYAMMHPYIFFAALFALAAVLMLSVYAIKSGLSINSDSDGAC